MLNNKKIPHGIIYPTALFTFKKIEKKIMIDMEKWKNSIEKWKKFCFVFIYFYLNSNK